VLNSDILQNYVLFVSDPTFDGDPYLSHPKYGKRNKKQNPSKQRVLKGFEAF